MRYVYSVVRFVPDPASGEFVNVGAVAGSEASGDWSVRQAPNPRRARSFGPPESLTAVYSFLTDVGRRIDEWMVDDSPEEGVEPSESWLQDLYVRHRNIVQLSPPAPVIADSAEEALDIVFPQMISDAAVEPRGYATKHRVLHTLRRSYRRAGIESGLIRERAVFISGALHTPIDFVLANGRAVQLARAWSFQIAGAQELAKEVKAWGYAMRALRETGGSISGERPVRVDSDVDVEVLFAPPRTPAQEEVFAEATQVFREVNATARTLDSAGAVAAAAAQHLSDAGLLGHLPGIEPPNRSRG